jgi:hypothetical protein
MSLTMAINKLLAGICCLSSLLLHNCSTSVSGVETTNGYATVTATETTIEGTAPPLSQVYMCDTGYIPYIDSGIGFMTSADVTGDFQFTRQAGRYTIAIISPRSDAAGVTVTSFAEDNHSPQHLLELPGSVSGAVTGAVSDTFLVYLAGMSHYQVISGGQVFSLRTVPAGRYRLRIIKLSGTNHTAVTILYDHEVSVNPGEAMPVGEIGVD